MYKCHPFYSFNSMVRRSLTMLLKTLLQIRFPPGTMTLRMESEHRFDCLNPALPKPIERERIARCFK
jgi:hypothetical protein